MRKLFVTAEAWPHSEAVIAQAAAAGATEIVTLGDPAAASVTALGYAQIAEPGDSLADKIGAACAAIDARRDLLTDAGFTFNGVAYQSAAEDRANIAGAAQGAALWLMSGGDKNTLRWSDPAQDFLWIATDNSLTPMSAATMTAFFQAGVKFKAALIFYAKSLKDQVRAASTIEALAAIDIVSSWPA